MRVQTNNFCYLTGSNVSVMFKVKKGVKERCKCFHRLAFVAAKFEPSYRSHIARAG